MYLVIVGKLCFNALNLPNRVCMSSAFGSNSLLGHFPDPFTDPDMRVLIDNYPDTYISIRMRNM